MLVRVWLGFLPGAPSCLCLTVLHLLICFAAWRATKFVSHRSGLVAVYLTKLGSWGVHICGCADRDLAVVPCWWSLYMCVRFFCGGRAVYPLLLLGVGSALPCLFWCDCSPFFLGHLRSSATCHAAGYPSGVPHLAASGWLTSSCSGGLAWGWGCLGTDVLLPHLGFYLVSARLPLPLLPFRGSAPLTGASACLTPVCWSTPGVGLEGSLLHHLVFSHVQCSSLGLLRVLLSLLRVPLGFSGHRVSVLAHPAALPLP